MVKKHITSCCALCQITGGNNDTFNEIKALVEHIRLESTEESEINGNYGRGQRAIFTIVSPGENKYEVNLITLGFKQIAKLNRRRGYSVGDLKMYFLYW